MRKVNLWLFLFSMLLVVKVEAQRVYGYFPSYRDPAILTSQNMKDKVTDIAFSFINAETNGTLITGNAGDALFGFDFNRFITVRDYCNNNGVKLWLSLAGADNGELRAGRMKAICMNTTARQTLATQLANFCATHNCFGISVDWEFPKDADARNAHVAFLEDLRTAVANSAKPGMEIAIAVGGEYKGSENHINYVHNDLFASKAHLVDEWHIMTYDFPVSQYDNNHSTLIHSKESLQAYQTKGVPMNKMYMGVPFYGRNATRTQDINFNQISGVCTNAATFNGDVSGQWYYNGMNTINAKIDETVNLGAKGIIIWDLGQDCASGNSLLSGIQSKMNTLCPIPNPNLGPDQGVCDGSSVTLDPKVPSTGGRTFAWYKDDSSTGHTGITYPNISQAGTYKVVISQGSGCTKEATIKVVTGSSVNVQGANACPNENLTLTVTNAAQGKNYRWFDQAVAGSLLHTGTSYTAQYTNTTDVYVEEQADGVVEYTIANTDLGGADHAWGAGQEFADWIDVKQDLTLKGARVYAKAQTGATFNIKILSANIISGENAVLQTAGPFTVAGLPGAQSWEYAIRDIELDIQLEPGEYFIYPEITAGDLGMQNNTDRTKTSESGVYEIAKNASRNFGNGFMKSDPSFVNYGYLYNVKIQTGASASCGRTKVTAVVNAGGLDAPVINGEATVTAGSTEKYTPAQSNPGVTHNYTYSGNDVTIEPLSNGEVNLVFGANATSGTLTLTLDNGSPCGAGTSSTKAITVSAANQDPVLTFTANPTANVTAGQSVTLTWNATDPDGDNLTYVVKHNGNVVSWTSPRNWTATEGTHTFEVTVSDGNGGTDTKEVVLNVGVNQNPVVTLTASNTSVSAGEQVTFTWTASDPDGDDITVVIKHNGTTQSWTSPHVWTATSGNHTIELTVTDSKGGVTTETVQVSVVDPTNENPTVTVTASSTTGTVGSNITFSWTANDPDGNIASTEVKLNGNVVSWTSPQSWTAVAGTHTVTVTVTDDKGATASDQVTVTITAAQNNNPVLTFTGNPTANVTVGQSVTLTWSATDPDGDNLTYVVKHNDNVVSWTSPRSWTAVVGSHTFEVTVSDGKGGTDTKTVTLNVTNPGNNNQNPVVNLTANTSSVQVGQTVTLTWSATDPDGDNLTVTVKHNGVTQSWTNPYNWTATTSGSHTFEVTASDGNGGTDTKTVSVTVTTSGGSSIVFISPTSGRMGDESQLVEVAVNHPGGVKTIKLVIDDGSGDPLFGITERTLTINGSGNYTTWWTPTEGNYTLKVVVVDNANNIIESSPITVEIDPRYGVGLDDLDPYSLSMVVYPNPMSDYASVDMNIETAGNAILSVVDMTGNTVKILSSEGLSSGIQSRNLDASDLPAGMYLLRLDVDGEVILRKFSKE